MINKQNLWFITLFSIILVLSIYYVTISDNTLTNIINTPTTNEVSKIDNHTEQLETSIQDDDLLAQRVSKEEEEKEQLNSLQTILLNESSTIEQINDAYESIKQLNYKKGTEEKIEKKIKEEFNLNSIVKINGSEITIIISNDEHNKEIANNIIRKVQEDYSEEIHITIKFQNKSK